MTDKLDTLQKQTLVSTLEQLEAMLLDTFHAISKETGFAYAASLPIVYDNQSPNGRALVPNNLEGDEARSHLCAWAKEIRYQTNQHPSVPVRAPGVLTVTEAQYGAVLEINALKASITEQLSALSRTQWRALCDNARIFRQVAKLQLTRRFTCYESLDSATFAWAANGRSNTRMTVAQALTSINKRDTSTEDLPEDQWNGLLRSEEKLLRSLDPTETLCRARPVNPYVGVNVWQDGVKSGPHKCALPIIVKGLDSTPSVTPLTAYQKKVRKQRSDNVLQAEPLIPRLHIYRYQESSEKRLKSLLAELDMTFPCVTLATGEWKRKFQMSNSKFMEFGATLLDSVLNKTDNAIEIKGQLVKIQCDSHHCLLTVNEMRLKIPKAKVVAKAPAAMLQSARALTAAGGNADG